MNSSALNHCHLLALPCQRYNSLSTEYVTPVRLLSNQTQVSVMEISPLILIAMNLYLITLNSSVYLNTEKSLNHCFSFVLVSGGGSMSSDEILSGRCVPLCHFDFFGSFQLPRNNCTVTLRCQCHSGWLGRKK